MVLNLRVIEPKARYNFATFAAIRRASSRVSSLAADSTEFILKYRRLSPFKFAGVPVVAGDRRSIIWSRH